ncbi:unnamed protein product [Allacma fusca]|uniref:acid phosphatase n=1 Tax=Allacma fusca TaxID=39272 RepID=A0A8J2MH28_9HEXA|nr:unnamed protein product [Allacma fusca]
MNLTIFVIFFQGTLLLAHPSNRSTLKFSQVIFRHGDRNPRYVYGNYVNNTKVFPEGLENLTNLGKKHAFELGQFLRRRSNYQAEHSPYEPIPIRVIPTEDDNFFSLNSNCPVRALLTTVPFRTFFVKRHFQDEPEILEYIFRQSGETALFDHPQNSLKIYEVFEKIQEVIHCLAYAVIEFWSIFRNIRNRHVLNMQY